MRPLIPLRESLLTLLQEHHFLSAYQLLALLHERHITVNKTSVYRALNVLIDQKKIFRQVFKEQSILYERSDNHHDHLVCCGKVTNISCQKRDQESFVDFAVEFHTLNFFGYCKKCVPAS